jgi:hypothetical protein
MERFNQVVKRAMLFVGVCGAGGVIGLLHSAIVLSREGGARVRFVVRRRDVVVGGNTEKRLTGAENAEPISDRVSERTCMRIEGAM